MATKSIHLDGISTVQLLEQERPALHPLSQKVVDMIQSPSIFRRNPDVSMIQAQELDTIMQEVMEELVHAKDPVKAMEELASAIPLEKLQEVVKVRYPMFEGAVAAARDKLETAQYYLETTDHHVCPTLKTRIASVLDSMNRLLESVLSAFGIADFFKSSDNDIQSDMKGHKIFSLLQLFTLLSSIALPLLGASLASYIIGGILLSIVILSIVHPYIRGRPHHLPQAVNWTTKLREGTLEVMEGRKQVRDAIAQRLISNNQVRKYPLLLGKSGVGKTETVKAFAAAVERGDYPELKGKEIFYFNVADIVNYKEMFNGGNKILEKIKEKIGRHRNDVILVFDEIHLACVENPNCDIGNQLKSMLDPNDENFPYVIAMTTEEEYYRDIVEKNKAFARRFECMGIDSTDELETLSILRDTLLKQAPHVKVEEGALAYLFRATAEAFPDLPQPAIAINILSQCIQMTSDTQKSPLEDRIEETRKKIRALHSEDASLQGDAFVSHIGKEQRDLLQTLKNEQRFFEAQLVQDQEKIQALFAARQKLGCAKKALFDAILKVGAFNPNDLSSREKRKAGAFLLLAYFLSPALDAWVQKEGKKLHLCTAIDNQLINQVIAQEREKAVRVQEAIARGKQLAHQ